MAYIPYNAFIKNENIRKNLLKIMRFHAENGLWNISENAVSLNPNINNYNSNDPTAFWKKVYKTRRKLPCSNLVLEQFIKLQIKRLVQKMWANPEGELTTEEYQFLYGLISDNTLLRRKLSPQLKSWINETRHTLQPAITMLFRSSLQSDKEKVDIKFSYRYFFNSQRYKLCVNNVACDYLHQTLCKINNAPWGLGWLYKLYYGFKNCEKLYQSLITQVANDTIHTNPLNDEGDSMKGDKTLLEKTEGKDKKIYISAHSSLQKILQAYTSAYRVIRKKINPHRHGTLLNEWDSCFEDMKILAAAAINNYWICLNYSCEQTDSGFKDAIAQCYDTEINNLNARFKRYSDIVNNMQKSAPNAGEDVLRAFENLHQVFLNKVKNLLSKMESPDTELRHQNNWQRSLLRLIQLVQTHFEAYQSNKQYDSLTNFSDNANILISELNKYQKYQLQKIKPEDISCANSIAFLRHYGDTMVKQAFINLDKNLKILNLKECLALFEAELQKLQPFPLMTAITKERRFPSLKTLLEEYNKFAETIHFLRLVKEKNLELFYFQECLAKEARELELISVQVEPYRKALLTYREAHSLSLELAEKFKTAETSFEEIERNYARQESALKELLTLLNEDSSSDEIREKLIPEIAGILSLEITDDKNWKNLQLKIKSLSEHLQKQFKSYCCQEGEIAKLLNESEMTWFKLLIQGYRQKVTEIQTSSLTLSEKFDQLNANWKQFQEVYESNLIKLRSCKLPVDSKELAVILENHKLILFSKWTAELGSLAKETEQAILQLKKDGCKEIVLPTLKNEEIPLELKWKLQRQMQRRGIPPQGIVNALKALTGILKLDRPEDYIPYLTYLADLPENIDLFSGCKQLAQRFTQEKHYCYVPTDIKTDKDLKVLQVLDNIDREEVILRDYFALTLFLALLGNAQWEQEMELRASNLEVRLDQLTEQFNGLKSDIKEVHANFKNMDVDLKDANTRLQNMDADLKDINDNLKNRPTDFKVQIEKSFDELRISLKKFVEEELAKHPTQETQIEAKTIDTTKDNTTTTKIEYNNESYPSFSLSK